MSDARQLLQDAQAAEVKGDKAEAVRLLRRAAEIYRDKQLGTKAIKLLRHIRRLEGVEEEPPPFETELFEGPSPARQMPERGPVLADPAAKAWCSFCCRPQTEAGRLVAAPTGTFICSSCIKTAAELLG